MMVNRQPAHRRAAAPFGSCLETAPASGFG